MKIKLLIFIIGIIIGALLYSIIQYRFFKQKPERVEIVRTETKWLKPEIKTLPLAQAYLEYKKCFESPIFINYTINNPLVHVIASDGCKETNQDIKIEMGSSGNFKLYLGISAGVIATAGAVYLATQIIK